MRFFQTENPSTLEPLEQYRYLQAQELEEKLSWAQARSLEWRWSGAELKASQFRFFAVKLREQKETLALTMAAEMGKPLIEGRAEVEKCALAAEHYGQIVKDLTSTETLRSGGEEFRLLREPLGVVLGIMPWNYPLWQVVRAMVPILAGGNAFLLKPSEITAGTALLFEKITDEVFGRGLVTNLFLTHEDVALLIQDSRVKAVTLTGSTRAGGQVAAIAGQAMKKCVLELGGSDAFVVLPDADLESAVKLAAQARLQNNGQSCIAAKRILVPVELWSEFTERLSSEMDRYVIGLPEVPETQLGPLAHRRFAEKLRSQQETILKQGAKVVWQKEMKEVRAAFVRPALLHADPSQPAYLQEEFFGPIALATPYQGVEQAVLIANASPFGLGVTLVGKDRVKAENLAPRFECGVVAINRLVASDPRVPFGGVKQSGYGKELGLEGLREFQSVKTVLLKTESSGLVISE